MTYPTPSRWCDQLWRAVLTVLVASVGVYLAWQLLSAVWPALLVVAVLLLIIRFVLGGIRRRTEW